MQLEPERLVKILEVLRELPVPNYRCVGPLPTQSPDSPRSAQALCAPGALTAHFSSCTSPQSCLCLSAPFVSSTPQRPLSAGPWSSSCGTWCTWPH